MADSWTFSSKIFVFPGHIHETSIPCLQFHFTTPISRGKLNISLQFNSIPFNFQFNSNLLVKNSKKKKLQGTVRNGASVLLGSIFLIK